MNRSRLSILGILVLLVATVSTRAQDRPFSEIVGNVKVGDVNARGPIQVPYIFWGGDVATFYANGGLRTQSGTIFAQQGLNLNLVGGDDFTQQVRDYVSGKSPYLRCTMGMLGQASEVIGSDPRTKPVVFLQLTWSKGDHLVTKPGIKTLSDLKGKTIALQQGGPHVKLLDDVLKLSRLGWDDIRVVWTKELSGDTDSPLALLKKRNDIDGAFVITPDMIALTGGLQNVGNGAEGTVKGARVLASTSELSRSIADVYVCRDDWYKAHHDEVVKFAAGYMKACESVVEMQAAYNTKGSKEYTAILKMSQDIFGKKALPTIEEDAKGLVEDAVFVGYPGNVVFFTGENNAVGFDTQTREVLDLAEGRKYVNVRSGFLSANIDYQSPAFVGYLKETKVAQGQRFRGEAVQKEIEDLTSGGGLDDRTLISFTIQFAANATDFNGDTYGAEFQRVVDTLSKAGNGVIAVRGHADPTKTLADFVKAGVSKGTLKQSGTTGNYNYFLDGSAIDLSDTKTIVNIIDKGAIDNAPNGINPKETMQEALNLSRRRAEAVRQKIIEYANKKNLHLDPSQIQPSGVGVKEPLIAKPRNTTEANQNMRVEFRLVRVVAEPTKQGDFDF